MNIQTTMLDIDPYSEFYYKDIMNKGASIVLVLIGLTSSNLSILYTCDASNELFFCI